MQGLQKAAKATRTTIQRALDPMVEGGIVRRTGAGVKGNAYRWWAPTLGGHADPSALSAGTQWTLPWRDRSDEDDYVIGTS
jgi:hypothetical protein